MIAVKAKRDDAGHWYLIPNELVNEFNNLLDYAINSEDDGSSIDLFENTFSKYRTGGDLNNTQLYING